MTFDFEANPICVTNADGGLIARFPQRIAEGNLNAISWISMMHERRFLVVKVLVDSPDRFEFESDEGRRFSLRPMTMELYRSKVLPELVGDPGLRSQKDLERHFLVDTIVV